jgi:predicted thioesterase
MFNVGDMVKIKSRSAIMATLDMGRTKVGSQMYFPHEMEEWCGTSLRVVKLVENEMTKEIDRVRLDTDSRWVWHLDWLDPEELDNRRIPYV